MVHDGSYGSVMVKMLKIPFNFNLCTTVEYVHLSVSDKEMESVREILRGSLIVLAVI